MFRIPKLSGVKRPLFRLATSNAASVVEEKSPTTAAASRTDTHRSQAASVAVSEIRLDAPLSSTTRAGSATFTTLTGSGRSIAVPMQIMAIVGDTAAGVLLAQLIYWTRRGIDVVERDGWIFKTAHEWEQETGMTWKVQRRARTLLLQLGLMEERKQQMPARLEFRLNLSTLVPLLAQRAEVEADDVTLARFRDVAADDLIGRAFLFHTPFMRLWPVHTAMMASRLLASARLPALDPHALHQAAARLSDGRTKLLALHRAQWHAETGLSRDHWQTARRNLLAAGVLVERRHNFPRRVDMALNLRRLAELLRQSAQALQTGVVDAGDRDGHGLMPSSDSYGLDRAKQVGGIGHCPIPPSHSPDPAETDRPILPTVIAQSRLYPLGLQGSLHPQPQSACAETRQDLPIPPSLATVWGGGGFYGVLKLEIQATRPSAPQPPSSAAPQLLAWPSFFSDADQVHAVRHLAGLDRAIQQCVLDEMEWIRQSGKAIRSPVALARTLARSARGGSFVPDGAHRIAAARADDALRRQRGQEGAAQRAQAPQPGPLSPEALEQRARLKNALDEMRRRSA